MTLSVILTLAGGHKVSAKQNLSASFSCMLFNWSGWNLMWCWHNSSWRCWYTFLVRLIETKKNPTVLLTAWNTIKAGMHSTLYQLIWLKLGLIIAHYILISVRILNWIGWNDMLLRLVGLMNIILILSHSVCIQGREPHLWDFTKKKA